MSRTDVLPELKQILGAMIFGADRPIGIPEMLRCLKDVAENKGGEMKVFAEVNKKDVQAAVDSFAADVRLLLRRVAQALAEDGEAPEVIQACIGDPVDYCLPPASHESPDRSYPRRECRSYDQIVDGTSARPNSWPQ